MDAHLVTPQQIKITRRNYFGSKLYSLFNCNCVLMSEILLNGL